MKYAIFGDIHGADLGGLEKALRKEKPDVLVCTGDFDSTSSINQFRALEARYRKKGKDVIVVPGNHDEAILNNSQMNSVNLFLQGKTVRQLHQELVNDSVAHNYLRRLVNSRSSLYVHGIRIFLDKEQFEKEYDTVIVHGGLDGNASDFEECPEDQKDLLYRLKTIGEHAKNFREMSIRGHNIMIRGHDHKASYARADSHGGIVVEPHPTGQEYRLGSGLHTITPGALCDGMYATIDTRIQNVPVVSFKSL